MENKPLVSVCMITYNHEKYIAQAIEGVLNQTCDFDIELIIADDASTDMTSNVIFGFQNHPNFNWIKYFKHPQNLGMLNNFKFVLSKAQGKYIALCDGDDYWIRNLKLSEQLKILENEKQISAVFTDCNEKKSNGYLTFSNSIPILDGSLKYFNFSEVVKFGWFIPTCTLVFRKPKDFNLKFIESKCSPDWLLHLYIASFGTICYLNIVTAVYRREEQGITHSFHENRIRRYNYYKCILNMYSLVKNEYKLTTFETETINKYQKIVKFKLLFNRLKNLELWHLIYLICYMDLMLELGLSKVKSFFLNS